MITNKEVINMDKSNDKKDFFTKFLQEFRTGLRSEDQTILDQLIQELTDLSLVIPPSTNNQYTFREILMLITLINQKKIHQNKIS